MRISDWSSDVCSSDLSTGPLCRLDPAAACARGDRQRHESHRATHAMKLAIALQYLLQHRLLRPEARRVGKECVSTCRTRCASHYENKKKRKIKKIRITHSTTYPHQATNYTPQT